MFEKLIEVNELFVKIPELLINACLLDNVATLQA